MLLRELDQLFSDTRYPGDDALGDLSSEWACTLRCLQGKNWRSVKPGDFDSQSGLIEGVQALSPKGFVYFLPGLVRLALTDVEVRYAISIALLSAFTRPDYLPTRPEDSQILSMLSLMQRRFLISFLNEVQAMEPQLCPIVVNSAKVNLQTGTITPYLQKDVEHWANTFPQEAR